MCCGFRGLDSLNCFHRIWFASRKNAMLMAMVICSFIPGERLNLDPFARRLTSLVLRLFVSSVTKSLKAPLNSIRNPRKSALRTSPVCPTKVLKDQFHPQRTEAYTTEMFNPNNVQQTRPRLRQHSPPQRISRTHHK